MTSISLLDSQRAIADFHQNAVKPDTGGKKMHDDQNDVEGETVVNYCKSDWRSTNEVGSLVRTALAKLPDA